MVSLVSHPPTHFRDSGCSNAMLPSHLSESKRHGRSPFFWHGVLESMSRALPRGAETYITRTTGSVNDGQSSKVPACKSLAVIPGSGGWVKTMQRCML